METDKKVKSKPVSINNSILLITVNTVIIMAILFGGLNLLIARYTLRSNIDSKGIHIIEKLGKNTLRSGNQPRLCPDNQYN